MSIQTATLRQAGLGNTLIGRCMMTKDTSRMNKYASDGIWRYNTQTAIYKNRFLYLLFSVILRLFTKEKEITIHFPKITQPKVKRFLF